MAVQKSITTSRVLVPGMILGITLGAAGLSGAADLDLPDVPVFLLNPVEPNVFLLVDDSGSMESEVLIEGAADGVGTGAMAGYYVLPTDNNGRDKGYVAESALSALSPAYFPHTARVDADYPGNGIWRLRSTSYNTLYYDPAVTYQPWPGTDSLGNPLYTDANPSAAPVDPTGSVPQTVPLDADISFYGSDLAGSRAALASTFYPARYYTWDGDADDEDADGHPVDPNEMVSLLEIKSANAPFPGGPGRTDCASPGSCSYAEEIQNFANWFTYHRKRSYVARAALGEMVNRQNAIRLGLRAYNAGHQQDATSLSSLTDKATVLSALYGMSFQCNSQYDAAAGAVMVQAADCPATPARSALSDLGQYLVGNNSPILAAGSGGECQQNFGILVTDGFWNQSLSAAQQSRYADDDSDGLLAGGGASPFDGGDYADDATDDGDIATIREETLADIAMHYYENDLKSNLGNKVPTMTGVDEAAHQHLVTYAIALGVAGNLDPGGTRTPQDATDTDPTDAGFRWPEVEPGTPDTIDDLWHATFNGRGQFFDALDPVVLNQALDGALRNIADRSSSASSVALSSGSLSSASLLFQSKFSSRDWTGQLLAYGIISSGATAGSVGTVQWDAGCELTGGACAATGGSSTGQDWNTGRTMLTSTPPTGSSDNGTGVAFRWPANPAAPTGSEIALGQVAALKLNPDTSLSDGDAVGEDRLNYLRGKAVSGMRSRNSLLGDIVDSTAFFVGPPAYDYPDSLEIPDYSAFAQARASRTPVVYVGANDGMLHGFKATPSGGNEVLAYVPSKVYDNLPALTSKNYGGSVPHRFFVNASPVAGDVVIGSAWKTILVGGLGAGGQGIYALDVTDPSQFSEANASSLVLWEFSDAVDSDLGFSFGQPAIVRLANGQWGVIVGGGYNQTEPDGQASADGDAHIFVLNAADGSVIKKFDTQQGTAEDPLGLLRPNGIRTVTPVDVNFDRITDYLYAGDLFGNIWKIDLRSSSVGSWDFAFKSGATPAPLLVARDSLGNALPVTAPIEVGPHPVYAGQMLYFGTGKYLEAADNSAAAQLTQAFFGVWDRNEGTIPPTSPPTSIDRSHLLRWKITQESSFASTTNEVRLVAPYTTGQSMRWHPGSGAPSSGSGNYLGWVLDLINTDGGNYNNYGERIVYAPVLHDGRILFSTLIPETDPCEYGGDSWLMELDASDGSNLAVSPFDLNGDQLFTAADLLSVPSGGSEVVAGVKSGVGLMPTPTLLRNPGTTASGRFYRYASGSTGGLFEPGSGLGLGEDEPPVLGRQSWRQIQ